MPTPSMLKALDDYERYFRINWNCPYGWNSKAGKCVYNGKLKTLKGWVLAQFSTTLVLSALLGCLGACNFSKSCNFSLTELMMIVIWTTLTGFTICFDVTCFLYSEDAILGLNWLIKIHSRILKRGKCKEKFDALGICCQWLAMMFGTYPYFLTFFGIIIFNMDPFYFAAKQLKLISFFHSHLFLRLNFILMRILLTYPTVIQGCRVYSLLAIVGSIILKMLKDSIRELQERAKGIEDDSRTILLNHAELEIILKTMQPFLNFAALLGLAQTLLLDVFSNYVTLKLHGTIPMPFYLFFPSVSIVTPLTTQIVVPVAGDVAEEDKTLHQKWAFYAKNCRDKRYLMRRLRSVGALQLYAGLPGTNIFPVVSSTKGTFYSVMIDYTISALLSF